MPRLDIVGDSSSNNQFDAINRLAGLFSGNPEFKLLPDARNDYAAIILSATGPWKSARPDQTDIARVASARVANIFSRYNYQSVDAAGMLLDLGVQYEGDAVDALVRLLPPLPEASGPGFVIEDARIAALLKGMRVTRVDADLIRTPIAIRVRRALAAGAKK